LENATRDAYRAARDSDDPGLQHCAQSLEAASRAVLLALRAMADAFEERARRVARESEG
jgi:hypothetical protein